MSISRINYGWCTQRKPLSKAGWVLATELHVQRESRALREVSTAAPRGWALHGSIMWNSRGLAAVMETGRRWLGVRLRTRESFGAMARLVVTCIICLSKLTDATLKMGAFYIQIIAQCWLKTKWRKSQRWPDFAEGPQHERKDRTWKNRELAENRRQGQRKYTSEQDMLHRVCFCFWFFLMFGVM